MTLSSDELQSITKRVHDDSAKRVSDRLAELRQFGADLWHEIPAWGELSAYDQSNETVLVRQVVEAMEACGYLVTKKDAD